MPAEAALHITVSATFKNVANPGAKGEPDSQRTSEVVLGETYISSRTGDATTVYDFAQRRRYLLDEKAKTFDDYSLFDVIGFRELELRNREGLDKAMSAMKLEHKLPGQVEHEHELSVNASGSQVTARADGADEVFVSGDATLLRRSGDATAVSAVDAEHFAKFLRYTFGGHAAILSALQKEQRIPARITYTFQPAWGTRTVELKISSLRQGDEPAAFSLAGYQPRPATEGGDALDAQLDRAWASRAQLDAGERRQQARAAIEQWRARRPIDVFLAVIELQLSGDRAPLLTDEQKAAFQNGPAVRQLSQALAVRDQNGLRQAVGSLQWLRGQAQTRRYLLKLFEANDRMLLGERDATRALYADVLQANPALAGAYKDIGDFYFRNFDTPRAWRSWEIGRRLAPLFPNLEAVTQFERSLATRFPEYF